MPRALRVAALLVPVAALSVLASGCSEEDVEPAPSPSPSPVATGSPLKVLSESVPGPGGAQPACAEFAPGATCVRVGDVTWVLVVDGKRWTLTEYDVDEELQLWVPGMRATGTGTPPAVHAVDLSPDAQPESVVVYADDFDVVATGEAGIPAVVLHAEGRPTVSATGVRLGDRQVRLQDGVWVLAR